MTYRITRKQFDNLHEALRMWATIPPKNVISDLIYWRESGDDSPPTCDTIACFGGWCAWWPAFRKQGLCADEVGAPCLDVGSGNVYGPFGACEALFGRRDLFNLRLEWEGDGTDHEIVERRIRRVLDNCEVID